MADVKRNLLVLFERPAEPIFTPKGKSKTILQVPEEYITEKYKSVAALFNTRYRDDSVKKVFVKSTEIPDLTIPLQIKKDENFSIFIPKHKEIASALIDIFMKAQDVEDLLSVAAYCRDRLNASLFQYALSKVLLNRSDTKNLPVPNPFQSFPGKFINSKLFSKIREEATVFSNESRQTIVISQEYTGSTANPENRVAYFREDLGLSTFYWSWHLINSYFPDLKKERAGGEAYYFMHQQIVARYNNERLSNNLPRVKRLNNLRKPLREGYFPKLNSSVASRSWPPRLDNTTLSDINRPDLGLQFNLSDLETWLARMATACSTGYIANDSSFFPLFKNYGTDQLGDMLTGNDRNKNYGPLGPMGQLAVALCHDPDGKHNESFGVMADAATALRDPAFYRWHTYLVEFIQKYKAVGSFFFEFFLPPIVTSVRVETDDGKINELQTFWQQSDVDISRGLDFVSSGPVNVRFTHLQHVPFQYRVDMVFDSPPKGNERLRLYMAPKYDELGNRFTVEQQRMLFILLDNYKLRDLVEGKNVIIRKSVDSSVTIPFEKMFQSLDDDNNTGVCGCGWPHHLLIPKGTAEGMKFDLFAVVSSQYTDSGDDDLMCGEVSSYCASAHNSADSSSLGYPVDAPMAMDYIDDFNDASLGQCYAQEITVVFTDKVVAK